MTFFSKQSATPKSSTVSWNEHAKAVAQSSLFLASIPVAWGIGSSVSQIARAIAGNITARVDVSTNKVLGNPKEIAETQFPNHNLNPEDDDTFDPGLN